LVGGTARAASLADRLPPLGGATPPEDEWRRYFGSVKRWKWLVVLIVLAGTALGVLATRLVEPYLPFYTATSNIWIDGSVRRADRNQDQAMPGPINSGQLLGASGWVALARSYIVLDSVARHLRLYLSWDSPADSVALGSLELGAQYRPGDYRLEMDSSGHRFRLLSARGVELQRGTAGDSIGGIVGLAWLPPLSAFTPGRRIEFTVSSPYDAATVLAQKLQVEVDPDGNFLQLSLRGADPAHVATLVNAVAARFVDVATDLKRKRLSELTSIVADQLDHAQANLRRAEAALRAFQIRTATLLPGAALIPPEALALETSGPRRLRPPQGSNLVGMSRDPAFTTFLEMRVALEELRHDRTAIERVLAPIPDSGLALDALALVGSVARSTELSDVLKELVGKRADLRALRYRYTDANPEVRRVAGEVATLERRTIPALARGLVGELATREAELGRQVESASGDLRQLPTLAIDQLRLERDVVNAQQLYSDLQQRSEEARLAEASSLPDVRVLDAAVEPRQPFLNAAPFLILLSFLGSLGAGVLAAVLRDRADQKLRDPAHVTKDMGLPILGALPHWKAPAGKHGNGNGNGAAAAAPVIEALRGIRLSLIHAHGTAGPLLVTITSPGSGEGKSFVAANLGLAFADAGHKTLLIDGDIRRGQLHRVLNATRTPGLTNALTNGTAPAAIVQATAYPHLSFIGCGLRTPLGPELLGSAAMARLFAELRPHYEVILVDSPPLSVGVDPYILGTLTGNVLLVLRSGVTDRELASTKLDAVDRLPIRLLGAVLNDIRQDGAYRCYSYFPQGYELREEEAAGPHKRILATTG
jgi:tyrosine-protein kinase Etk/Wzc